MARISASIPEDLKDELYQMATDTGRAISHIIVDALEVHLRSTNTAGSSVENVVESRDTTRIEQEIEKLTQEIQSLKEVLTSRTATRGSRFF